MNGPITAASWLVVLLIWGLVYGFKEIPPLCWWMLLPFAVSDAAREVEDQ